MFDTKLRGMKDQLLTPFVTIFGKFEPLMLTGIGFLFGLGAGISAWNQAYGLALGLWILNRVFDGLDGLVARKMGKTSWIGGYLDLLADFIVYSFIPISLVWGMVGEVPLDSQLLEAREISEISFITYSSQQLWVALAFLLASFYVNAASWMLLSQKMGELLSNEQSLPESQPKTTFVMPRGLMEGFETIVAYSLFLLFPNFLLLLFWIIFGFTVISIIQRIFFAITLSNSKDFD